MACGHTRHKVANSDGSETMSISNIDLIVQEFARLREEELSGNEARNFSTATEIREKTGMTRYGVNKYLCMLRDEGRLDVRRVTRMNSDNRACSMPGYRVIPVEDDGDE